MSQRYATVEEISNFLRVFFSVQHRDVPFLYHKPFSKSFSASRFTTSSIVLSITPTEGVYKALEDGTRLAFLHRPFDLERRRVPRLATVLSSHKGFDEVLTVGYNPILADRLDLDVDSAVIIQGYKGDPNRRIGIVAKLRSGAVQADALRRKIVDEFGNTIEGTFGFNELSEEEDIFDENALLGIAIMNAFHVEEVDRVVDAAQKLGLPISGGNANSMLYLTGAVREPGVEAALGHGMKVICVGHRMCEEWGIRYLAKQLRLQFPSLAVLGVFEDEKPRLPSQRKVARPEQLVSTPHEVSHDSINAR